MNAKTSLLSIGLAGAMTCALACDQGPDADSSHTDDPLISTIGGGANADDVLYVWASDAAHVQADFVAVIGFKSNASNYGKVIRIVPVPAPGNIGNEPHHVG